MTVKELREATANPYLTEAALIGQCLPDLDDLPVARTEVDSPTVPRLREVVKRTKKRTNRRH